ncbi:MAG: hypothetical protein HIU85_03465 [Proteobacteria bacterium]|nr:hypothetical protein [Pseudomonadota bacterium]
MSQGEAEGATGMERWTEALGWYTTLREADESELTIAVGRKWQDWYADAANRQVFDDMCRLIADRNQYRMRVRPRRPDLRRDQYDLSMPIAEWRAVRARKDGATPHSLKAYWRRWRRAGAAAAAVAVVAVAMIFVLRPMRFHSDQGPHGLEIYKTPVGGTKDIQLRDGTSIILGGHTKVSVIFTAHRRSVNLIEGQAWFKVADSPRWPFVVSAGRGSIKDLGTAFLVTREADRVVVTVTQGSVEVAEQLPWWTARDLLPASALRLGPVPIRVVRGEQLTFDQNGALDRLKHTDIRTATAWTRGSLIFDDQPLRYVVETVNRYSSKHIFVSSSAGSLRISGVVFTNETQDWLHSLQCILPVTVREGGGDVRIRMRRSNQAAGLPQQSSCS